MIIHSYLTDNYFKWAILFLNSFKLHNGEDIKVVLSSRNLEDYQIESLYDTYKNLDVQNEKMKMEKVAKKAKLSTEEMCTIKRKFSYPEESKEWRLNNLFIWKLYASVEDRYKVTILENIRKYPKDDMLHLDIDLYIRDDLTELFKFIEDNDITIKLRNGSKYPKNNILGGILGFKNNKKIIRFLHRWIEIINEIPLHKKPKGYGQISLYETFEEWKDKLKWTDMGEGYCEKVGTPDQKIWACQKKDWLRQNYTECVQDMMNEVWRKM